jgi:hypothetical protein
MAIGLLLSRLFWRAVVALAQVAAAAQKISNTPAAWAILPSKACLARL